MARIRSSSGSCFSFTNSAFATANACVANSKIDDLMVRSGAPSNISTRALDFTIVTFRFDFGVVQIDKDVVERRTRSQRRDQFLRRADLLDPAVVNERNSITEFLGFCHVVRRDKHGGMERIAQSEHV